jgi:hypothetical protein
MGFHCLKKGSGSQTPVAHTCNPTSSEGRDQKDPSSKPVLAKFLRPYLKNTHHKNRDGGVVQGVGPEFKPQYHKNKTKQQQQQKKNPRTEEQRGNGNIMEGVNLF